MDAKAPIYISGRQHCGNTLLVSVLSKNPGILGSDGECTYCADYAGHKNWPLEKRISFVVEHLHQHSSALIPNTPAPDLTVKYLEKRAVYSGSTMPSLDWLYMEALHNAPGLYGYDRFCLKDTSLIFYIDHLFRILPRAKLIYLIRSPLDICSSARVRTESDRWFFRNLVAWNRGTRRALAYQDRYPQRLRVFRFEDLISDPEATIREVCAFVGARFSWKMLDVQLVNPARHGDLAHQGNRGFVQSKIGKYKTELAATEANTILRLASRQLLRRLYPEQTPIPGNRPREYRLVARLAGTGFWHTARDQLGQLRRHPAVALRRLRHKLTT